MDEAFFGVKSCQVVVIGYTPGPEQHVLTSTTTCNPPIMLASGSHATFLIFGLRFAISREMNKKSIKQEGEDRFSRVVLKPLEHLPYGGFWNIMNVPLNQQRNVVALSTYSQYLHIVPVLVRKQNIVFVFPALRIGVST